MRRKEITATEYNKLISKIIKKGHPIEDTLVEMLEEASKYTIKGLKRKYIKGKKK